MFGEGDSDAGGREAGFGVGGRYKFCLEKRGVWQTETRGFVKMVDLKVRVKRREEIGREL